MPGTVDEIADALRSDPILLSEMMGNGATAELDAALHTKLEQATYPVFVVLTRTPTGMDPSSADEDLATLLHAELGRDGVYFVETSQGYGTLAVYGDLDPAVTNEDDLISLARFTAMDQVTPAVEERWGEDARVPAVTEAGVVLDVAARAAIPDYSEPVLTDAEVASYTSAEWHTIGYVSSYDDDVPEPASVGLSALVAVSVCLVVWAVAFRLIRAAAATATATGARTAVTPATATPRRARAVEQPPARPVVRDPRADAERRVTTLVDDLEKAGPRAEPGAVRLATEGLDVARRILADPTADELDLVGAEVLARIGSRALGVSTTEPYRACFVNPVHGRGAHLADLPGGLSVPVCRPCERDLEAGREPDALCDGRDRPYFDGDTVWARTGYGALTDELWSAVRTDLDGRRG